MVAMDKGLLRKVRRWANDNPALAAFIISVVGVTIMVVVVMSIKGHTDKNRESLDATKTPEPIVTATQPVENDIIKVADKPSAVVTSFINKLTNGNPEAIREAFGTSDVYTPEAISDRIKVARVSYMSGSIGGEVYSNLSDMPAGINGASIGLHICTLDYEASYNAAKAKEAELKAANPDIDQAELKDQVERDIAKRTQSGEFDAHYNVNLAVEYEADPMGAVQVTEEFKQAITGGWYRTGEKLTSVECPLGSEAMKAKADNSVIENYRVPDATESGNPDWNGTTAPMPKAAD